MHVIGHNMNLYKGIQVQVKYTKETQFFACVGGGRGKYMGANKHITGGQDFSNFFASTMTKSLKKKIPVQAQG